MSEQFRAARRAYIRDHHPDRGGDPAMFIEGLQSLRDEGAAEGPEYQAARSPVVQAYRSRRTAPGRWIRRLRRTRRQIGRNLQ